MKKKNNSQIYPDRHLWQDHLGDPRKQKNEIQPRTNVLSSQRQSVWKLLIIRSKFCFHFPSLFTITQLIHLIPVQKLNFLWMNDNNS